MKSKKILLLGHNGFLAGHVFRELQKAGAAVVTDALAGVFDLREYAQTLALFRSAGPDMVVNCAGRNGGLAKNASSPFDVLYDNTLIGLNAVRAAAEAGVKKILSLLASCGYPDEDTGPKEERDYLRGEPHESVACHAHAKRQLLRASLFARDQFGLDAVCVCPPTLFGPGDRYEEGRSKVVASLVMRFVKAAREHAPSVTLWGTGRPLRDVMYVKDAARLIPRVLAGYDDRQPLNLSSGQEPSVRELADTIARLAGYRGEILWDASMPDGQHRKCLDRSRMRALFPDFAPTPLFHALRETVRAYEEAPG